jgi:hypothetical protein
MGNRRTVCWDDRSALDEIFLSSETGLQRVIFRLNPPRSKTLAQKRPCEALQVSLTNWYYATGKTATLRARREAQRPAGIGGETFTNSA